MSDLILRSYSKEHFTPVFTVFSCVIAILCFTYFSLCERFFYNCQLEQQLVESMRVTLREMNTTNCRTTLYDVHRTMMAAIEEETSNEHKIEPMAISAIEEQA